MPPSEEVYPDQIGVYEQAEPGFFSVGISVLAGRLTIAQMRKVADLAERHGNATIRLTARQNLLFLNIPKEKVASILEGLAPVGLKAGASMIARSVLACAEKEFCRELIQHREGRGLLEEPIQIHVSGRSIPCAHSTMTPDIELQGNPSGSEGTPAETFGISTACDQPLLQNVPASEVRIRVEQLLVSYKKRRKAGESFSQFCQRVGGVQLVELLSPPRETVIPAPDQNIRGQAPAGIGSSIKDFEDDASRPRVREDLPPARE